MVAPNTALGDTAYVALLKAKQGELLAIQSAAPAAFVPLLEVIDLAKAPSIVRGWPHHGHVVWVHALNFGEVDDRTWATRVTALFGDLRREGLSAVPVVTLAETDETYEAVAATVAQDGRGLVLRLDVEDVLNDSPAGLAAAIDEVMTRCGVGPHNTDVVLDIGLVAGAVAVQSGVASSALNALPHITQWRSLVTAFSGFPELVSDHIARSTVGSIARTDAAAFVHLTARWTGRSLTFGDYGVGVPTYADVKWSPIPNIRYARPGEWIVHRAATKIDPSPQYRGLARDLVAAPHFDTAAPSAGDRYIRDVASGAAGPGNAGSYLRAAMSRHIHVVLDSLATRGAP